MIYTRSSYIESPSLIEKELLWIFNKTYPKIIFDIGSCEGEDSIKYSRLFPNSRILAFEPLPENLNLIKKHLQQYKINNVEIVPIALSNFHGSSDFYISSGNPEDRQNSDDWNYGNKSSSLLEPYKHLEITEWLKFNDVIKVDTDTLENICNTKEIHTIDFIHLDVQGNELKVLQGAGRYLTNIKVIWLEVSAIYLYKDQPLKAQVEKFMKENGFCKIKDTVDDITGDQLYLNIKYFKKKCRIFTFKNFIKSLFNYS